MATVYGRIAKISNVVGRSDYLNDEKRQEKIVLQKKEELSDWVSSSYVAFNLYFCLLELYHELLKSKRPRLSKS